MNIDFSQQPGFSTYVLLLIFSGALTVLFATPAFGRSTAVLRLLNAIVGMAMIGYGIYLGFIFTGGHYVIVFKAFVVPLVLVIRSLLSIRRSKAASPTAPTPLVWTPNPAAPFGQPQFAQPPYAQPQYRYGQPGPVYIAPEQR
jgi:hypothetical protein